MSTSAAPIFNGTSTFSTALPDHHQQFGLAGFASMNQLQGDITTLGTEQTALSSLSTSFSSLQSDVAAIDSAVNAGDRQHPGQTRRWPRLRRVTARWPGRIVSRLTTSVSQSTATSTATVTNPTTQNISTSTIYTLTANSQRCTIEPPVNSNTLDSLVDAINSTTAGAVQATVVNVGTTESPSYELSLQSSAYSSDDIGLDDGLGSGNILNPTTEGSPIQYDLGGQTGLTSDTQTLTISPNLTATVVGTGTTNITIAARAPPACQTPFRNSSPTTMPRRRLSPGGVDEWRKPGRAKVWSASCPKLCKTSPTTPPRDRRSRASPIWV